MTKIYDVNDFKDAVALAMLKEVADILNIKGYGRNNLFKFLREQGILNRKNEPYRSRIHYFI